MPLITICPRCTSHLGLSQDVTPAAQVQCPICEVEFSLATVVPRGLPQARLIDHAEAMATHAGAPSHQTASVESAQDRLSALLRSTSQWRPTPPADPEIEQEEQDAAPRFAEQEASAADQSSPASLKLGDSRLDQLLSDLIKDSGPSAPVATQAFSSHLTAAERDAVEYAPSQHEFQADLDDESTGGPYAHDDEYEQSVVGSHLGQRGDARDFPSDLQAAPRRRRKPKIVRMLVGIVAGGAMGIILGAYGLLWIKGPPGDFLGIARYLPPAMLPPSVTQIADDRAAANDSTATDVDDASSDSADEQSASALADVSEPPPRFDPQVAPASVEQPVESPGDDAAVGTQLSLAPDSPAPTLAPEPPPTSTAAPATDLVKTLRGVPLHTLAELDQSLQPADAALTQFLAGDLAQQQSWATMGPAYITLAALAEQFTLLDPAEENGSSTSVEQAKDLFRKLMSDAARRADLATVAARWLQHERRQNQGVILVGKVRGATQTGPLTYSVDVPLGESVVTVDVITSGVSFQSGDDIAVVGAILTKPAEQLPGYPGSAPQLVVAGWAFTPVPSPAATASP